ncbi:MAG: hypothetical protein PUC44_01455 [Eubacteriales bacterium]|nr:hypothetical protein [Eubacteriales bacterium]
MEAVSIQFVANSGVFVKYRGLSFLIDGIFGNNPYFTPPIKEIKKAVFGMNSPFRDVDFLLFTHRHTDHFSAVYADEYAANNRIRGLFVPRAGTDPHSYLEDQRPLPKAEAKGILYEIYLQVGERLCIPLADECSVTFMCSRHLDWKTYATVVHCSILLTLGTKQFLFAADADGSPENRELFCNLGSLTAIFVTPLFFVHPDGRHLLEAIHPETAVLYHIPFKADDVTGLRPMVERELQGEYSYHLKALTEPGQTLFF